MSALALGETGKRVARNVQRLREQQRLTFVELSRRLAEAGRPIAVLGLRRIELLERRVDVDDAVALAAVLAVSVETLLFEDDLSVRLVVEAAGKGRS